MNFFGLKKEDNKGYGIALWSILALSIVAIFVTFECYDIDSITAWSVNFWDLLFKGDLAHFYDYAIENLRGAQHGNCMGNYLWLIPVAIWNLPLWLTHTFGGITPVVSPGCILWSKTLFVVMMFGIAWMIQKTARYFGTDGKLSKLAFILVLGSSEVLISCGMAGQDEVVYLFFMMTAVYFWTKSKRGYFLLFGTIAVSCCPIMLLLFILLVVIEEKNWLKIVVATVIAVLPSLLFELLYKYCALYQVIKQSPDYNDALGFLTTMFSGVTINGSTGAISVTGCALCVIILIGYFRKQDDKLENQKFGIALLTILMVVVSFFMEGNYYRMLIYVPFLILFLLVFGIKEWKTNLFFLMILNYIRLFLCMNTNHWECFNFQYRMKNVIYQMGNPVSELQEIYASPVSLLYERFPKLEGLLPIVNAVSVVLVGLLFYFSLRKSKNEYIQIPVSEKVSLVLYILPIVFAMIWFYGCV